jgi:hypothetical protein
MHRVFRLLEEYVDPPIVTVDALSFVFLLDFMLKCSSESISLPFVENNVSTVTWILEFYYLD